MSRMTKAIAESVSEALTNPYQEKIRVIKDEMGDILRKEYLSTLPKDLLETFAKHPNFFKVRCSLKVSGFGLDYTNISFKESVPHIRTEYGQHFLPQEKTCQLISKKLHSISELEEEFRKVNYEIYSTLLSLGTYKRVEKEFPEAYSFLPMKPSNETLPALQLKTLRDTVEKLKKEISEVDNTTHDTSCILGNNIIFLIKDGLLNID